MLLSFFMAKKPAMLSIFSNLPAYFAFSKLAFRQQRVYRVANITSLFTTIFFLFFKAALFESIYPDGKSIRGFTMDQTLTYVCLMQVIYMIIPQYGQLGIEEDIRSGQISTHLSRPVSYYFCVLSQNLGKSEFFAFYHTLPLLCIGAYAGFLLLPASFLHALGCLISIFLGAWIAISLHFIAEISAFWLESPRGAKMLLMGCMNAFSGLYFPLTFFPPVVQKINHWLPFEYTSNAPILIYLSGHRPFLQIMTCQLLWILVLTFFCHQLLTLGEKKITFHGG